VWLLCATSHAIKAIGKLWHMMIFFGYTVETKAGRPIAEQDAALRAGGVTDFRPLDGEVYRDGPAKKNKPLSRDALADMIMALRPGAAVVVAGLDVLASTREGLREALTDIGKAGAVVKDMEAGETLDCRPEALAVAAAIDRAVDRLHAQRAAAAREAKGGRPGSKGGRRVRWLPADYDRAEPFYRDPALTNPEVAAKARIPYRTLHREMARRQVARGAARFGRGRSKPDGQ